MAKQKQTVKITIKKPVGGGRSVSKVAVNVKKGGSGATRRKKKA